MNIRHLLFVRCAAIRRWACQLATLMLLGHQVSMAQTNLKLVSELRFLLDTYHSDFNTPENYDKAVHELATRPEFKPMLLEILQRDYFEEMKAADGKPNTEALNPLGLRSDLTVSEQKIITDELERLIPHPEAPRFVNGGINLLAHYPSPEHEDLVLRFLNRPKNRDYTLTAAFKTLSVIGGSKSMEAMQRVAARLRKGNPGFWFLPELDSHIATLATRLKKESVTGRTQATTVQALPQQPSASPKAATVSPESPAASTDWRVWLALLGGLILVIALSCRVFRKKH